jgi:hypothetical protein
MLRIDDNPREELGAADPGRDEGIRGRQPPHRLVGAEQESVYRLIERVLKAQQYRLLSKGQKGIVRNFLAKITALSRAQVTRPIRRWVQTRRIERKPAQRPNFPRRYTAADVATLAEVADFRLHRRETPSQLQATQPLRPV